jgi:hypothetical protein
MATYSKRGYKAPKERAVEETVEGANSDEKTAQLLMFLQQTIVPQNQAFVAKTRITSLVL